MSATGDSTLMKVPGIEMDGFVIESGQAVFHELMA